MATYVGNALFAHANGGCYRCGRGDSLVDLDVQIVGEGALTLCKGCISEAAEAASLTFNRARIRELEARILELEASVLVAADREKRFEAALSAAAPAPPAPDACAATTKAGAACKGTPVAGTDRCVSHA